MKYQKLAISWCSKKYDFMEMPKILEEFADHLDALEAKELRDLEAYEATDGHPLGWRPPQPPKCEHEWVLLGYGSLVSRRCVKCERIESVGSQPPKEPIEEIDFQCEDWNKTKEVIRKVNLLIKAHNENLK